MRRLSRSTRLPYSNSIDRRASYANANGRLDMAKKPVAKKSPLLTNNMDKRALPKVPRNKTEGPVNTTRKMKRHHEKLDTIGWLKLYLPTYMLNTFLLRLVPKRTPEAILSRSSSSFNMTPTRVEQLKSVRPEYNNYHFVQNRYSGNQNKQNCPVHCQKVCVCGQPAGRSVRR
jgi:hypothetical protein